MTTAWRMMRRGGWFLWLFLLFLNGCSQPQPLATPTPAPSPTIEAHPPVPAFDEIIGVWVLQEMDDGPLPEDVTITLMVGPSSFSGKAVCNAYHFYAEPREDGSWRFPLQEHTVVNCGPWNDLEKAYWSALVRAQQFERVDGALWMKDGSGHVLLRFRRQ